MAQTYTNTQYIQRRRRIGTYANLAGLAILGGGFFASLNADKTLSIPTGGAPIELGYIALAYIALIVGFALSAFGGRYLLYAGLEPETKLALALKGLDKQYRLYCYATPAPFVLLTPSAIYVLHVKPQDGLIATDGKRWWQPFSLTRLFRWIAVEPLGNPERQLESVMGKLSAWLQEQAPGVSVPGRGFIVFLHPRAQLSIENSNAPILALNAQPDALKVALRKDRGTPMPSSTFNRVADLLKENAHAQAAE